MSSYLTHYQHTYITFIIISLLLYDSLTCALWLSSTKLSWHNASTYCQQQCINSLSSAPYDSNGLLFVKKLSDHTLTIDSDTDIWTGFRYISSSSQWEFPDGTLYTGWSSTDTNCGKLSLNQNTYEMITENCNIRHRFLCNNCDGQINPYIPIKGVYNWNDGELFCNTNFDTSLASIHNINHQNIAALLCQQTQNTESCYIGLNDISIEGTYVWTDDTQFDYIDSWGTNQPNNENGNENCVDLFSP
eukprot:138621_1